MIKKIAAWYKKIVATGTGNQHSDIQNKHTRLVNIYVLISLHTALIFYVGDLFVIQKHWIYHCITYFSFVYMAGIFILNKKKEFSLAKIAWIAYLFIFINLSALQANPGIYTEYYFLLVPGICLSVYQKNIIPVIATILGFICFFIPYYFFTMYPEDHPNREQFIVVGALFYSVYAIVNYFKKLNIKNELSLKENNKELQKQNRIIETQKLLLEKAYAELEVSKKNELAFLQLKSLRSQMNPHFIFNSLNSIQDLILQQNTDASYDYIVLFARLVRNTLNYSNKDFIAIDKELEFLEVYLQLEKLRFEDDFAYTIQHTHTEGISVPSLLVQPFIENALLHGLLHKSGKKELIIDFTFTTHLTCTITDNGIGRREAKKIQERQGGHHQSFALEAIQQRLEILKEQYGAAVGYQICDLYDQDFATGTKVEIIMPYQKDY